MKTGLITIHDTVNYGSLLQTIGLYSALSKLGVDVELIDYRNDAISSRESTYPLNECKGLKDLLKWFVFHRALQAQKNNYWDFLKEHANLSHTYNRATIIRSNKDYNTFIIGSDIVWNMEITGHDMAYMLDFAEETKRKLAFSASVGTKWRKEDNQKIKDYLSSFESISVREYQASEWIKQMLGRDIPVTCDPTMLWDGNYWKSYCVDTKLPRTKYVLVYMPDATTIEDAKKYAKERGLEIYFMNFYTPVYGVKNVKPIKVQNWLSYIANAETMFTSSYHGLLFSLYFHTNVFYYNRAYSARMLSLCKDLQITHREGIKENIVKDGRIDFETTDKAMANNREMSWKILRSYFEC